MREGSCCNFPFSYNGAQYYHCILSPKNNERMWCATTPYFEQDKQWGYCPRSGKNLCLHPHCIYGLCTSNTGPIKDGFFTNHLLAAKLDDPY